MWLHDGSKSNAMVTPEKESVKEDLKISKTDGDESSLLDAKYLLNWIGYSARRGKLALKFWRSDNEPFEPQAESSANSKSSKSALDDAVIKKKKEDPRSSFSFSARESLKAAITHFGKKWHRRLSFLWRHATLILGSFQKLWVSKEERFLLHFCILLSPLLLLANKKLAWVLHCL